jgi:hypothetical protein
VRRFTRELRTIARKTAYSEIAGKQPEVTVVISRLA